ncbi:hypothetical protein QCA50_018084 [Cerrena zonata]|uniref:Uncharacterized protein n=1 Tax=Cerrena zonata TaxID=2478898 RepID=A0AAW0FHE1_9APHY
MEYLRRALDFNLHQPKFNETGSSWTSHAIRWFSTITLDIYLLGRLEEVSSIDPPVSQPTGAVTAVSSPPSDVRELYFSREYSTEPQLVLPIGASSSSAFTSGAAFPS